MGLMWSPESGYVKELQKWELRPTALVPAEVLQALGRPMVPVFHEYPKAMYRAKAATGGPAINGYIEARDASHEAVLTGQGWSSSQEAAIARVHAETQQAAQLDAERQFAERRMSPKARAEAQRVDDASPAHVPVIPETPIRKRVKRPYVRKTAPAAAKE